MQHGAIQSFHDIFEAIEDELQKRRHLPALILIYTTIDSVAWLTSRDDSMRVRARFEAWVNRWIVPILRICSATELYAARCGILHTFTSRSDLSASCKARRVAYSLGAASPEALQKVLEGQQPGGFVVLNINALYEALRSGIGGSLSDVLTDDTFATRVQQRLNSYFGTLEGAEADRYVSPDSV